MTPFPKVLRACVAVASVAAASIVGASCSTPASNGAAQVYDRDERFPISVQPRMMTLRLLYNGQSSLDENASGQIARFARDYLSYGSGSIAVASPSGNPATSDLIVSELLENGVSRNQIMVGAANAPGPSDDFRITYIRYVAESPACGDWSDNLGRSASNTPPANFGCATQRNIAAMVADPRDLLSPDRSGVADAQRRLKVLDNYRKGLPTPAETTDAQSAFIADVGQ
jgi:pilus assembly protein CpaD